MDDSIIGDHLSPSKPGRGSCRGGRQWQLWGQGSARRRRARPRPTLPVLDVFFSSSKVENHMKLNFWWNELKFLIAMYRVNPRIYSIPHKSIRYYDGKTLLLPSSSLRSDTDRQRAYSTSTWIDRQEWRLNILFVDLYVVGRWEDLLG